MLVHIRVFMYVLMYVIYEHSVMNISLVDTGTCVYKRIEDGREIDRQAGRQIGR